VIISQIIGDLLEKLYPAMAPRALRLKSVSLEERFARCIHNLDSNLNPPKAELLKARRAAPQGLKGRSASSTGRVGSSIETMGI